MPDYLVRLTATVHVGGDDPDHAEARARLWTQWALAQEFGNVVNFTSDPATGNGPDYSVRLTATVLIAGGDMPDIDSEPEYWGPVGFVVYPEDAEEAVTQRAQPALDNEFGPGVDLTVEEATEYEWPDGGLVPTVAYAEDELAKQRIKNGGA